jgi:hypothetical protein
MDLFTRYGKRVEKMPEFDYNIFLISNSVVEPFLLLLIEFTKKAKKVNKSLGK